jgi:hypothetical protein
MQTQLSIIRKHARGMKDTKEIKRGRLAVERNVKKSEKTHKEKKHK